MLRTELAELEVHSFQAHGIALGFESKMPDAAFELEDLQFGVGQHGGKEMGGLRGQGFGGRLTHVGTLFKRLVILMLRGAGGQTPLPLGYRVHTSLTE